MIEIPLVWSLIMAAVAAWLGYLTGRFDGWSEAKWTEYE